MRISDWSSDVCSSDLGAFSRNEKPPFGGRVELRLRLRSGVAASIHVGIQAACEAAFGTAGACRPLALVLRGVVDQPVDQPDQFRMVAPAQFIDGLLGFGGRDRANGDRKRVV